MTIEDRIYFANRMRKLLTDGKTPQEIMHILELSVSEYRDTLSALSAHGTDFRQIWETHIARTDENMKEITRQYAQAVSRDDYKGQRELLRDRIALSRSTVELAIDVGYLKAKNDEQDEQRKLAEFAREALLTIHKQAALGVPPVAEEESHEIVPYHTPQVEIIEVIDEDDESASSGTG